ncbi:MAG: PEP-CTERM sorting domain-containing protein [Terriglobia bacterium]
MRRLSSGFAWFILSAIAMAVAVPFSTYAGTIPPAVFLASSEGTSPPITAPGTVTGEVCDIDGCSGSTVTISYANGNASASGSGWASGSNPPNSGGGGEVLFYFSVECSIGTCPSETVPLIFTGSGSSSASGPYTEALAYFNTPGGTLYACSATGSAVAACGTDPSAFSGFTTYSIRPDILNDAAVYFTGASVGSGSWSYSVDGTVEIDPSFADAGDFKLEFSPNPATVPEPSSLWLFGTGLFALLGAVKSRWLAT